MVMYNKLRVGLQTVRVRSISQSCGFPTQPIQALLSNGVKFHVKRTKKHLRLPIPQSPPSQLEVIPVAEAEAVVVAAVDRDVGGL